MDEHVAFLNEQYALGHFLASGPKIPRTGGIILCNLTSKSKLESILHKDPFKKHQLANYECIEFQPRKTSDELKFLIP